jgi:tRNA (guanosine-2'-O-)-methyltransferase
VDPLEGLHLPERVARIDRVLRQRLGSIVAVFEDLYYPHNVAACLRSAEGVGLQEVHVITSQQGYAMPGGITRSADAWLSVCRHADPRECLEGLRARGFALWAADLEASEPLAEPAPGLAVALVFGNEHRGISPEVRARVDRRFLLPMHGMVQSFNVSVACALTLHAVAASRRHQLGAWGDLTLAEMGRLRRRWLEFGIRDPERVRRAYGDGGSA